MNKIIMNTFIQFVNRSRELDFLEGQARRSSALVILYGRRRVGKSELLKRFLKGKNALYLLATQEVEKEVVESFSEETAEHFGDASLKANPFSRLSQLLEYLGGKELRGLVLAIDEFPYLVDANSAAPSIIQKHWETRLRDKGLKLVLCGSSIGAMEAEALGRKSPLYGRRTGQWKVEPLAFRHFAEFFPKTRFERLIEMHSICGGIPLYILELDAAKSAYENARDAVATRGSILYQEAEVLLKEELREPKTYFSLLKEISAGRNSLNELSNALGAERTSLTRYLSTLAELDLIEASKPVTAKEKSKSTAYVLKDNYFKFWFRFVYPFKKELDSFSFESFKRNFEQNFNAYVGRQFERVCLEALTVENPISAEKTGSWWGSFYDSEGRKESEIDMVSLNQSSKKILFAECKWQIGVDALQVIRSLEKKAAQVEWENDGRKECFAVFAKSFRQKRLPSGMENTFLYDMADLEKIFRYCNT